jgi:hypothetical protein
MALNLTVNGTELPTHDPKEREKRHLGPEGARNTIGLRVRNAFGDVI